MDSQKKLRKKYIVELEMKNEVYEDVLKELETLLQDNDVSKASLIVEFNKLKNVINEQFIGKNK